jgi:S-DNA-T family DNA segregation ATPase FtsK/SpoIIIE
VDGRAEVLDLARGLEELVAGARADWSGPPAPPVRVLPRRVCVADLPPAHDGAEPGVPLGLSGRALGLVCVDLAGADPHFLVFGDGESGKTTLLRTLVRGLLARLAEGQARILVVDYRRTMLGLVPASHLLAYAAAAATAAEAATETAQALERRLPGSNLTAEELRTRSWWKGPDVYVVVDDYDMVTTGGSNPLQPLLPFLPQARDVGLHVILARRVAGAARAFYDPILGPLKELGSAGIVLAGDPQEGALLGTARPSAMPPGRGLLVRRRERPELVQVATSDC